jgi:circadian clock protein KaiC
LESRCVLPNPTKIQGKLEPGKLEIKRINETSEGLNQATTITTNLRQPLPKTPTGITGLDEITGGGLPRGRPTIIAGGAGCGKTLLGIEFIVRGITEYNEPGVFVAFEETAEELAQNVRSLGFDLEGLEAAGKLIVDHVQLERSEIEESGEYDLEGLFIRLGFAIDSIGAKRVVLDTLEALFAHLPNQWILRAELRRLFRWLKDKGVTAIITAERGDGTITRHGLEEYVSDCVILLDHRVADQVTTRRLRIVKYRGSSHGSNEYPYLIDDNGISILPITSVALDHQAPTEQISTGIPRLDTMLSGKGYYRGSSILVSGTAGAGKSSLAAHLADATARRGERCLYISLEESPRQIVRNMRSIGIDLDTWIQKGLLHIHSERPTAHGLEMHLIMVDKLIRRFQPHVFILDPINNLTSVGSKSEVKSALVRLIDYLKSRQITALFTSLTSSADHLEETDVGVSSLMDTWILLKMIESNGERNRGLYVLKARGLAHSNQIREFQLTAQGLQLTDVYMGTEGGLTGTARLAQEAKDQAAAAARRAEAARQQRLLAQKRKLLETRIAALQAEFAAEEEELLRTIAQFDTDEAVPTEGRKVLARQRGKDRARGEGTLRGPDGHDASAMGR